MEPRLRGQGIGSAIVEVLTSLSRGRGVDLIEINVERAMWKRSTSTKRHGFRASEAGSTECAFSYSQELAT